MSNSLRISKNFTAH